MSTNLSSVPKLQFFDANGNPLVGGKLFTYAAGTTTPLATYTDSTGLTPNTNPIILDSRGEANVWLDATQYKFELKTAADALIWTVDNISNALNLSQLLASSGSAASPPYTFAADTTTGMFLAAAGQIGLSANGKPVLRSTDVTMVIGQIGGADDVDVTLYGDLAQTGNVTLAGSMAFSGTGRRITGDFSNATIANRVLLETSTTNGNTIVGAIPNGTGNIGAYRAYANNDTANNAHITIAARLDTSITQIDSGITGTGTYLPMTFYTGGSERVRVDTSGNVGIGNTPSVKLDVQGAGTIRGFLTTTDAIKLGANTSAPTTTDAFIYRPANNTLGFGTASAERMRIDSSGNVGINTNSPGASLDIKGLARSSIGTGTGAGGAAYAYYQFGTSATATENWHIGTEGDGSFRFYNQGFGAGLERMRITSAGNVGIGTNAPAEKLEVAATTGAVYAAVNNGTVNTLFGVSAGSTGLVGTSTNHSLGFFTNSAQRVIITAAGLFQYDNGYGSVATAFGCRAWINFDGTSGSIGTGRGSGNVSSVTDNGTGDYTINFTNPMPDGNYAAVGLSKEYDGTTGTTLNLYLGKQTVANTLNANFVRVFSGTGGSGTATDGVAITVAVFR